MEGRFGTTVSIWKNINDLLPVLFENDLFPCRVVPFYEGICMTFKRDNIRVYVEFYNDGDVGLISENIITKKILDNVDLTKDTVVDNIKKALER